MFSEILADAIRPFMFRGKSRLVGPFLPRSGERTARVDGVIMRLDLSDIIQRNVYIGCFERESRRYMRRCLKPGGTFFDVGANVGPYTAMALPIVGATGSVYAFEPSPYAFGKLEEMVRVNRLGNVHIFQAGLGDVPGELDLYVPPADSGNHSPTMCQNDLSTPVKVPVMTIDDVVQKHGVQTIDFMKVDVEGFEERVLRGAERTLKEKRIRHVLCEFNEHWLQRAGSSSAALLEVIQKAGFSEITDNRPTHVGHFENRVFALSS